MASITRKKSQAKRHRRRLAITLASIAIMVLAVFLVFFGGFVFVASATFKLPDLKSKQLFSRAQTTKIYDANGGLITDLYVEQNRIVVPLKKISPYLQKAIIAIEDRRFYDHEGVDWKAIARALMADMRQGRIVEGGSTLTQQFVKNTLISPEKTFQRKVREAALAFQVERKFSKQQILEGYLNIIYFGQSAYGAETASQTFFNKNADQLTLPEAALLAGVIRSPNNYSPYVDLNGAKARRDTVLKAMLAEKMIKPDEARAAMDSPVQVQPLKQHDYPFPYFVEYVKQLMQEDTKFGSTVSERANTLFRGGLRIYTTIDPKMQRFAEDAAWGTLNRPEDPATSLVSIEPQTGYIKAMVGGHDWQAQKLNLATQGARQAGSAFKPFVLASAIEQGISISKTYESRPAVIKLPGGPWVVHNAEGGGGGLMNLRDATVFSVNAVFARLIMDVGPNKVVDLAKKMGIESPIESLPAIALGGLGHGVTALDMATAYSTFANGGRHAKPIAITKITDASGKVLKDNQPQTTEALDPVTAYLVTDILKDVISFGTGRGANIGRPAAGKTGTAENYGDAWFCGYTPSLATAVWVGYRDSNSPMNNVHGVKVFGGTFPAQIWRKFMSQAVAGTPAKDFDRPTKGLVGVKICKDMGLIATEFCPETYWATFPKGGGPRGICDKHKAPANTKVPNVIGMDVDEAKSALEQAGLTLNVKSVDRVAIPAGQVASQNPVEGSELPQGSAVEIEVSTGHAPLGKIKMPEVVGLSKGEAQAYLGDAGLLVTVHFEKVVDRERVDTVIGQNPRAGASVLSGSTVTIKVGK
ncbi:MAG: PBP1A family penicillin-binding protein [Actinomycetota bacterium]|nr:PBP1A family penicillin-binding protein [Actinomycetota bacterium]